ncbi:hypothetical protein PC112_g9704 [Phytophthora cactorum]|uniref:Uncharacterized protein n=1 Tax=Phytophthora cactorum TaxID=29920 RepID=A0A8T1ACW4_9STRA|nr:hypothetical protein PC112_g9704 [Phytophthora cactorum]KAG2877607.1 hypothetical protein PC115_g23327 [Phytophthora cactorum]KAG2989747.1 hypothetical protein PC120_g23101 [Phytophthora cactorum]KAG3142090.1 hypothetical protein C6341_g19537 [Phytophthora cactorum]
MQVVDVIVSVVVARVTKTQKRCSFKVLQTEHVLRSLCIYRWVGARQWMKTPAVGVRVFAVKVPLMPVVAALVKDRKVASNLDVPPMPVTSVVGSPLPCTPPVLLQDVYIDQLVAFSPAREPWMKKKIYQPAGTAYIVGKVCRGAKKCKDTFQICWLDGEFQASVENLQVGRIQMGIEKL